MIDMTVTVSPIVQVAAVLLMGPAVASVTLGCLLRCVLVGTLLVRKLGAGRPAAVESDRCYVPIQCC
jgi:hypothetical protein